MGQDYTLSMVTLKIKGLRIEDLRIEETERKYASNVDMSQCHKPPIVDGLYHPFMVIMGMVYDIAI